MKVLVTGASGFVGIPTTVVVTGAHFAFSERLRCRFGLTAVPAFFVSSEEVRCEMPQTASLLGAMPITVSNNGLDYSDAAAAPTFTTVELDSLTSTAP